MSKMHHPLIEIYPMRDTTDGGSTIHEGRGDPEFYDVIVRFEGDEPLEEIEGILTYAEAFSKAEGLLDRYPGSEIVEINL